MNLVEPQSTPFDLRWRMFGIRVRVHPSFWFFGALLGWTWGQRIQQFGLTDLLVWMGCYFFSVLVHELGHVVMGILCGQHGYIVLHFFGILDREFMNRRTVEHVVQHVVNASDAIEVNRVDRLEHDGRPITRRVDVVVRGRNVTFLWIQPPRQFGAESVPLELPRSGNGQAAVPAASIGSEGRTLE